MTTETIRVIHNFPIWLPQTQTWMYNQAKNLPKSIDLHIVCERTRNLEQFSLPNIHCLEAESKAGFYWEKVLRNLKLRQRTNFLSQITRLVKADIVHNHFGDIGWTYLNSVRSTGVKHVVTFYGYDVNRLPTEDKKWLERYQELFNQADAFLFEGPFMAQQVIGLGCPLEKAKVHHLGIEVAAISFKPRLWQPGETFRVLIAGSFIEKKGIPYALEALAQVQRALSIELTIIGDANSQRHSQFEKRRILEILDRSGLKPKTRLLGYQPHKVLFDEAYQHHLFILPSVTASNGDTEGGAPVSVIEMMATGMPVVSTSHCDIPEVVQYGMKDWLVPERDIQGLVDRLLWWVDNPKEWDNMLEAGRLHVENEYDAGLQGVRLAQIYQDVL